MTSTSKTASTGIPASEFIDDVSLYMSRPENSSAELVLRHLDEMHQKYLFFQANLSQKKMRLKDQIPEIAKNIELIKGISRNTSPEKSVEANFMLSDNVYAKADISDTSNVALWLGANVLLEYPIDEAAELLKKNLDSAKEALNKVNADLEFLMDQITTTEVSMARVYNWDVHRRREAAAAAAPTAPGRDSAVAGTSG